MIASMIHRESQVTPSTGLFMLLPPVLFVGVGLLLMALCREDQVFWTNAGGYPLWWRDIVREGFYPLVLLQMGFLFSLTLWTCGSRQYVPGLRKLLALLLAGLWILVVLTLVVAWKNNVQNWIEGRPLHNHVLSEFDSTKP